MFPSDIEVKAAFNATNLSLSLSRPSQMEIMYRKYVLLGSKQTGKIRFGTAMDM